MSTAISARSWSDSMHTEHHIAVLAGTPVDTQMGVDCLARAGLAGLAFPMASDPRRQTAFQISSQGEKTAAVRAVLETAKGQGCRKAFIYCNSLSGSVDFTPLAAETGMDIVTPLDIYRELAPRYRRLGLIAANAQGLAGIERTLFAANPELDLLGACMLPAVLSIEAGEPPRSWWSATACRSWRSGSVSAAWRPWCWAVHTSLILKRRWQSGQACRSSTRRRK